MLKDNPDNSVVLRNGGGGKSTLVPSLGFIGLFVLVTLGYVLIKGKDIELQVHDDLDIFTTWMKVLRDNNLFWKFHAEVPMLGGLDRCWFWSELKAYVWLHMMLPTFWAVIAAWYLKIAMAILGFVFLSRTIWHDISDKINIVIFSGFLYGIAPTYPTSAFSFASLPFLLGVIILLHRQFKPKYILFLIAYPIFSELAYFGLFICGWLVVFFLVDWAVYRRPKWRLLAGVTALSAGYVITEWRMFWVMFFSGIESLRSASHVPPQWGIAGVFKETLRVFVLGYYHCGSLHTYIVLPVCFVWFLRVNAKYIKAGQIRKCFTDKYNLLMILLGLNALVYGLDFYPGFRSFIGSVLPPLKGFSLARALWLNPFLWYFAFMIVLLGLKNKRLKCWLCVLAFAAVCFGPELYNMVYINLKHYVWPVMHYVSNDEKYSSGYPWLNYREFFSERLFERVKDEIGYKGEWSAAFGMHPAVIEYNGIATLDGYHSWYPQKYKEDFRRIIAPDLEIDEQNRQYFDNWGGRAYLFSDEVDYAPVRNIGTDSARLMIDPEAFREMGGRYIFSRVRVTNSEELGMSEVGVFSGDNSPYTIYVYSN